MQESARRSKRAELLMITNQKIAIVGGTAGIGLALARMAADAGAKVHLGGRALETNVTRRSGLPFSSTARPAPEGE